MKRSTIVILHELVTRYPQLNSCYEDISLALEEIIDCYKKDNKLLVCGNGGSAADALHIVGELMKSFVLARKIDVDAQTRIREASKDNADYIIDNLQGALPAISLVSETSLITANINDIAQNMDFAQQVFGCGRKNDILFAISTSGNSKNVLYASEVAHAKGMNVIALTGASGGKLKNIADVLINVPETETYKIQELHLPVYHTICLALENEFFGND